MEDKNLEQKLKNMKTTRTHKTRYTREEIEAMLFAYYIQRVSLREIGQVLNETNPEHPQTVKNMMDRELRRRGLEAYRYSLGDIVKVED